MLERRTPLRRRKPLTRTALAKVSKKRVRAETARGTERTRREWIERLDDLFRAIVMTNAGAVRMPKADGRGFFWYGACLRCRKERPLFVSHIEPKGQFPALRWDERNAFAFCYACHIHWWHKNPREANVFATEKLGQRTRDALSVDARWYGRKARADLRGMEFRLVATLSNLAPRGVPGIEW